MFAPTNDAFTALLARLGVSAETLLADNSTVTSVLLYHVVPGVFTAADLKDGQVLQTLLPGGTITVQKAADGTVTLIPTGGPPATVTMADIAADNGIVHIVDGVLLPGVSPAPSGE